MENITITAVISGIISLVGTLTGVIIISIKFQQNIVDKLLAELSKVTDKLECRIDSVEKTVEGLKKTA